MRIPTIKQVAFSLFLCLIVLAGKDAKAQNSFANRSKNLLIIPSRSLPVGKQPKDQWLGEDKFRHLIGSALITALSYNVCRVEGGWKKQRSITFSVFLSLSAGVGKEGYDKISKRGVASWKDLLADLAGIGLALLLFVN